MNRLITLLLLSILCLTPSSISFAHSLGIDKAELVDLGNNTYQLSSIVPP